MMVEIAIETHVMQLNRVVQYVPIHISVQNNISLNKICVAKLLAGNHFHENKQKKLDRSK